MARKKNGTNKSEKVREALAKNPELSVKEIVSSLQTQGVKVTPNLVYFIKAKGKARKRKAARQKAATAISSINGAAQSRSSPLELIRKVKLLAGEVGGLKKLRDLTEILDS